MGFLLIWCLIALIGASSLGILALSRGETINSVWLLTAAICSYFVAYRFYSRFLAKNVLELNDQRLTPAYAYQDGKDFVPRISGSYSAITLLPLQELALVDPF